MSLHDKLFSKQRTLSACGSSRDYVWTDLGKHPCDGKKEDIGFHEPAELVVVEIFRPFFGGKTSPSVNRNMWKHFRNFQLFTELDFGFPHKNSFFQAAGSPKNVNPADLLEKSTNFIPLPCVKLRFFHTVIHSLWITVWKIHKTAENHEEYVWEKGELSTATRKLLGCRRRVPIVRHALSSP